MRNVPTMMPFRVALYACGATFLLFSMNVLGKSVSDIYTPMEAVFWRNFMSTLVLIPFVLWTFRLQWPPMGKPKTMAVRSILGSVTLMLSMAAYFTLPLADANAIILSAPLILTLLAVVFLKEKLSRTQLACTILGLAGVLIVAQPSGQMSGAGTMLAIAAAVSVAVMRVLLRQLGKTEDPLAVTFYFLLIGTICTMPLLVFWGKIPPSETWGVLIAMGFCGALGQYLNGLSYKYGEASFVGMFVYTQLLWAIPFDYFLWNHAPVTTTLIGGTVIVISSIMAIQSKRQQTNHNS